MVCTDASVSTASTIDPGPVINYTGYLNNFPINAERHLVRLNFSNLRLTYLLTYSPHDKTNEALAKLSEAWKFEIEFARERERERTRILSSSRLLIRSSPLSSIQCSKRVKEREEASPHGLLFTPRFIHGVRKREAWDTRARLVRRIGKHGQGRQARVEWNRTGSRIEWCGIEWAERSVSEAEWRARSAPCCTRLRRILCIRSWISRIDRGRYGTTDSQVQSVVSRLPS